MRSYIPCRATCCWIWLVALAVATAGSQARGDDKPSQPQQIKHQVTGLFAPYRVGDLESVFHKFPDMKLLTVDFDRAEIMVEYDPAKVFPGTKPEELPRKLDERLRRVSMSTFGAKPLAAIPREKLTYVEIPIVGHNCKGCDLCAYEVVFQMPGVESATASFKDGKLTAWITAETDHDQLAAALKARQVQLKESTGEEKK